MMKQTLENEQRVDGHPETADRPRHKRGARVWSGQ